MSGPLHTLDLFIRLYHPKVTHDVIIFDHSDVGVQLPEPIHFKAGSGMGVKANRSFREIMRIHRREEVLHQFLHAVPPTNVLNPGIRLYLLYFRSKDYNRWIVISIEQHPGLSPIVSRDVVIVLNACDEHCIYALLLHDRLDLLGSYSIIHHCLNPEWPCPMLFSSSSKLTPQVVYASASHQPPLSRTVRPSSPSL